jgi:hypothetical protein
MLSVLWTCTPSLLAKAWSRAVFPRRERKGWEAVMSRLENTPRWRQNGHSGSEDLKTPRVEGDRVRTEDEQSQHFPALEMLPKTKIRSPNRKPSLLRGWVHLRISSYWQHSGGMGQ